MKATAPAARKRRVKTTLGRLGDWEARTRRLPTALPHRCMTPPPPRPQYLVGEAPRAFNPHSTVLVASSTNARTQPHPAALPRRPARRRCRPAADPPRHAPAQPALSRVDTPREFCWRIRNLPYPADVYTVSAEGREIVVRTSNKKYFKRITVPELELTGQVVAAGSLAWKHANNTLIITYPKPQEVVQAESEDRSERRKMAARKEPDILPQGEVPECKQQ